MSTDSMPIFDAALGLPEGLRGDLAAQLIASLDARRPPAPNRTPVEWTATIESRSNALHRGEGELVDGEVAMELLRSRVRQSDMRP